MNTRSLAAVTALVACLALVACEGDRVYESEEELGEALFHDPNLSLNRTMACATCHDPERAFTDGRLDDQGRVRPASLGDDGVSLGDRNAPTAAYAQLTPEFAYGARAPQQAESAPAVRGRPRRPVLGWPRARSRGSGRRSAAEPPRDGYAR